MGDLAGIGKAVEKLTEPVADIIKRIAGPAADEVGLLLQDHVHVWRTSRALSLVQKFKRRCQAKGVTPGRIKLNLLLPILDAASVEEDDDLHTVWSNLLADIASHDGEPRPYKAFIEILKQLTPEEARFYNALHDEIDLKITEWNAQPENRQYTDRPYKHPLRISVNYDLLKIYRRITANEGPQPEYANPTIGYTVCLDNLKRLGLLPKTEDEPVSTFARVFAACCRTPTVGDRETEVNH